MPLDPASDAPASGVAALTRRLTAGDDAAFREFHDLYFDRLYAFLLAVADGREHEAREALQETLLRVVRYVRKFEDEEVFWCWLKAVARSAARDGGRRRRRYLALLNGFALGLGRTPGATPGPPDHPRLTDHLDECLAELNAADRQLVAGKYLEGATVRELAAGTGLTEKAVESRLLRLRAELRERLLRKLARS